MMMPRPRKNIQIDFPTIDSVLDGGGKVDMKSLAVQYGTCPPVIRRLLSEHYGESIQFKPGRNGGVIRVPVSAQTPAHSA
jgi:hypothetical protein